MPYDSLMSRTDVAGGGALPAAVAAQIVGDVEMTSTVLAAGRAVPVLTRDSRVPVLVEDVDAYFVSGDSGLKQTSRPVFANQALTIEELAVLVPVPDSCLEDADYDLWAMLSPLITRAFARKIDMACLFGVGEKPASWPAGLVQQATAAGHVAPSTDDAVADLLTAAEMVASDQFAPTGAVVRSGWEYAAARQRTDAFHGNPIGEGQAFGWTVAGLPVRTNPVWHDRTAAEAIVADFRCLIYGVRREITFEVHRSGVLTDQDGNITHNLLQQDLSAIRATMRIGWTLAKPAAQPGAPDPNRLPVAIVGPATGSTPS